jgi:ferritin
MLSDKMQDALNKQINAELYSSYIYLAMSAYFESINLSGFAHWMRVQSREEMGHAMKIYGYIHGRRGRVTLQAIDTPPAEWDSPLVAFEAAFNHEVTVTGMIDKLVKLAASEGDEATGIFLQWFVTEQLEEEASADKVVQQLKLIGDRDYLLLTIDRVLAQRES